MKALQYAERAVQLGKLRKTLWMFRILTQLWYSISPDTRTKLSCMLRLRFAYTNYEYRKKRDIYKVVASF